MKPQIIVTLFSLLFSMISHASSLSSYHLIGYWQNFTNPAETPVRLTDIPSGYRIVTIAFADIATNGTIGFTLQGPPYSNMPNGDTVFKNDIKILQTKGVKVLLSLGGQNGYFSVNSTTQENTFITSLEQVITTYGFDGIDYDLESGLSLANEFYLDDATKKIKQDFLKKGKSLFFTIAPETIDVYWQVFPNGKYDHLIQDNLIDLIQVQLYNSGCMPGIKPGSACYSEGTDDFIVSQVDSTIQTWLKNGIPNAATKYAAGLRIFQLNCILNSVKL